jgi:hypothetical protein
MRWLTALMLLALSAAVDADEKAPPYVVMTADLAELKKDFNEAAERVRLVFIVGPT